MYVDGFVLAVKTDRKEDYIKAARRAAEVFLELGATRMVETWADDVPRGEITDFPGAVKLEPDETVCFSWVEYPDRETRDRVAAEAMQDPRLKDAMDPTILDDARMIYGGFNPIMDVRA